MLMIVILLFNLLLRSMSSFRGVQRTAVQIPMLRGSRGWLFSLSEAADAVNRVLYGPLVVVWITSRPTYSTVTNVGQ